MTEISKLILSEYQVRKTRKQKDRFIAMMQTHYPELRIEEGNFPKSRNLIVGDTEKADFLLTAHYDTCVALPFPNFLAPKNFLVSFSYAILIMLPFFALAVAINVACRFIFESPILQKGVYFICFFAMFYMVFVGGKANKHNANDNTSGVIMLCELMARLSYEEKSRCAFIFFDNEESGLLGSAFYRKKHKKEIRNQLIINFDCVSDGDNMLLVQNKAAKKRFGADFARTFESGSGKTVWLESTSRAMYPSDQAGFPMSLGIAATHKIPFIGLYLSRIHTRRDTIFDESNIEFLCTATKNFLTQRG